LPTSCRKIPPAKAWRRWRQLLVLQAGLCLSAIAAGESQPYHGQAFHDTVYRGGPQSIPGRVQCAYYDLGGEGIAYHDADAKNNGSGTLNPADGSYLNQFRMNESVDISYTKFHDQIDDNPYNRVQPGEGQLYVGWTQPGEWFNMTVDVKRTGVYKVDLLYTSNRGGAISFDLDGKRFTGGIDILSTYDSRDPVAWRQWHHWNLMLDLAAVKLRKGLHVLTLRVVSQGNMNFAYLDFKLQK
jgi:Carbohydrate binding module (family 6)